MDFTGKLHDLSLSAGRVQGLAEALSLITDETTWQERAEATLRAYLGSSTPRESNGRGGHDEQHDLGGLDG
jgi:hypothetical protein